MTFTYHDTDANAAVYTLAFTCELTGPTPTSQFDCNSGTAQFTDLTDGSYTFSVFATDPAGNADPTPATRSEERRVGTDTSIDSAIDGANTNIANGGTTPTNSITFTYHSTDANVAANPLSFTCKLTGPTPTSQFDCNSGTAQFTDLTDGSYTFSVFATDPAGNADPTPATRSEERRVGTDTSIDSAIDGANTNIANGGTTPTNSITFTYHSTDANVAANPLSFTCKLTGPTPTSQFDCNSGTAQFTDLTDGSYTFSVFATDPAGNADPTPATWTFTVEETPETIIHYAIDGANTNIANGGTTPTNSMTFTYHGTDANDAANTLTFTCTLSPYTTLFQSDCNSGTAQFTDLTDGSYTFSVFATDPAGNADPTPATWTFTVGVAPDTIIDSAIDGANKIGRASCRERMNIMTFTYHGTDANDAANTLTFTCELNAPTPTAQFEYNSGTVQLTDLTDGSYTFSVFATDPAGNADPTPATWTFTVGVAPDTIIDSAIDGAN